MGVIRTEGLSKYYGDTRGIDDSPFPSSGGSVRLPRPERGGKDDDDPDAPRVPVADRRAAEVLGADVTGERELIEACGEIGYLPADPAFDERTTGRRAREYYGALRGDERSDDLLGPFDPPLDRRIGGYSRGNKQMLAIVLAFMHDPDLVIMDEPTSGVHHPSVLYSS